ncbi:hypothetical protein FIBSPDRAFT_779300 [Athelia psychrophila]|uniref:25S rRNA (uridine-N(3))-methyltransferase BMT5-like domain-containing protein n=1 Tax=Athelia psychrophila TaxID=1759441 RepID=A0A166S1U1_9AGAM|nr:hypothetical protein FIBSPDRAFT_779300 [Fibularhizoctonia sp. CBS 109695]
MSKGKKKALKSTLQSQQSRLNKKKQAEDAAKVAEQLRKKPGKSKGKGKGKAPPPRVTVPFKPTDRILLVGEGNFSFAKALVFDPPASLQQLPAVNVTATAYDSEGECYVKYPEAREIVEALIEKGVEVLFDVDATKLEKLAVLKGRRWDRIVFNFPHAGKGIADQDRNALTNQLLLLGFLRSSAAFLALGPTPSVLGQKKKPKIDDDDDDEVPEATSDTDLPPENTTEGNRGTLLVTLRNVPPYTQWDLPRLAKNPPVQVSSGAQSNPIYTLLRSFVFHRDYWKGYEHRMTKGERAHGKGTTGVGGEDRTWEFCLADV